MKNLDRRAFIVNACSVSILTLSGCVDGEPESGEGRGNSTDEGVNENDDGDGDGDVGGESGEITTNVLQVGSAPVGFDQNGDKGISRGPTAVVIESEDHALEYFGRTEEEKDWIGETDFATDIMLYVKTHGRNGCQDTVTAGVEGSFEDGNSIELLTAARPGGEMPEVCPDVITTPTALVRLTGNSIPDSGEIIIVDSWSDEDKVIEFTTGSGASVQ